jgi:hypothetical protein
LNLGSTVSTMLMPRLRYFVVVDSDQSPDGVQFSAGNP